MVGMTRVKIAGLFDHQWDLWQLEMDSRLAKVLDLYSKGMKQVEIAEQLGHSQSLISKDLGRIRTRLKRRIGKMVEDEVWTYGRYLAGSEAALKKLWEIADDKAVSSKSRVQALELIMTYYEDRQGRLVPKALKVAGATKEKEGEIYGR
jgi:predicted transcriptional regulator